MKSLVQFLCEAQSKVTVEWMEEHYKKYNKELFDNRLPKNIKLEIMNNRRSNFLGCQGFYKEFLYNKYKLVDNKYQIFVLEMEPIEGSSRTRRKARNIEDISELDPFIRINIKYDFSDFVKEDTLIHEMVHLENHLGGLCPKKAHGAEFKKECNRVRELAKKLYGVEYNLTTYAEGNDDENKSYTENYTNEIKKEVKLDLEKEVKRGGGIYPILVEYDRMKMSHETREDWKLLDYTQRFVCCTKNKLESILEEIKNSKAVEHIWVGDPEVMKGIIKDYGKFSTCNSYKKFWNAKEYPNIIDNLKKSGNDILNINEGLGSWFKRIINKIMGINVRIKGGTPLDDVDFEEIVDYAEELENKESKEIKGSAENDKKLISVE